MPKNFSYGTVLTAPSPATSGTSLVLNSGQGALMPAVPFRATVWPIGLQPTTANAEIVDVTAVSTDTLTITRAMEGSTARTVIVGDQFAATVTAEDVVTNPILINGSATDRNYVLRGSQNFMTPDHFETGVSYTTEVPATSTLEIIAPGHNIIPSDLTSDSSWAWQTWTPVWANFTTTSGTVTARFSQTGKTVNCFLKFLAGASSAFGNNPTFTVPVPAASHYGTNINTLAIGYAEDTGVAGYSLGLMFNASTTVAQLYTMPAGGVYLTFQAAVTATVPFTLGAGDFFSFTFTYEAA